MRMLKKALIAYVNSIKAIWSEIAHPLSIVSKRKGTLKGYRIYGNSVQEGEPTPDNPIEVQSVGELTKNLFNPDAPKQQGFLIQDGTIHSNGNYPSIYCLTLDVKPNTLYTFNCRITNNVVYALYNEAMEFIQGYANTEGSRDLTFTTTSDSAYVKICADINRVNEGTQYFNEGDTLIKEPYHKYKVPVTARGKNLFGGFSESIDGFYTTSGTYDPEPKIKTARYISVIPNTTYTVSGKSKNNQDGYIRVAEFDSNKSFIKRSLSAETRNPKATFTTDSKTKFIAVSYDNGVVFGDSEPLSYIVDILLELSNTATSYEPYIKPQIHNIYLNEPLRKIGEYADCIDGEKSVVLRNVEKKVFDGTEAWESHATKNLLNRGKASGYLSNTSDKILAKSSHLIGKTWGLLYTNLNKTDGALLVGVSIAFNSVDFDRYIFVCPYSTKITPTDWKAQLVTWYEEGNPFTVWYAIPTEEEPIELPKLPQFKGTTIYEVQADIMPSGMEVCYYE